MAKQDKAIEGISTLIGGARKSTKGKKEVEKRSIGIFLTIAAIDQLDAIAAEIAQTRSDVMRFAIDEFISRYAKGEYQAVEETRTEKVTTLKPASD